MHSRTAIARALATVFVAGERDVESLVDRGSRLLGRRWRWLRPLAQRIADLFGDTPLPRRITVTKSIFADRGFERACQRHVLKIANPLAAFSMMSPLGVAESWPVPPLCTAGELADWLGITFGELEWFADVRLWEARRNQGRLRHYQYRTLAKRFGQVRMIESPKPRLKVIQRRILADILDRIPPHASAHGFRQGCSIKTFATPHVGKKVVLRMDLQDFFTSIRLARVQAIFRSAGYPEQVADLLAGFCTNSTPMDVWEDEDLEAQSWQARRIRWLYCQPHLPQGAPTSPALANLAAYRLDCRLSGLADSAGAVYTRYADDLAFSGDADFSRVVKRFRLHVCAIAMEEGFTVHHRKTRLMQQGIRQRLAGIVVNQRLNIPRDDFDRLKATLSNCIRLGAASQNRHNHDDFRRHLEGRLSFVEMINPTKGRRLRRLFDQIQW